MIPNKAVTDVYVNDEEKLHVDGRSDAESEVLEERARSD
jgi:hypothetical protein